MPPPYSHIGSQLRQLIHYNLDCDSLKNASFLAGRLCALESKSPEAAYLQALCYYRLGQFRAAYDTTKSYSSKGNHLGCTYVFAQSCLALEKELEGIIALDRCKPLWVNRSNWNKHSDTRRQFLPDAAAVYALMGKLWQAHNDPTQAIECFAESLERNPFMWDSFQGLCDLGANVRIPNIFKMNGEIIPGAANTCSTEQSFVTAQESPSTNGQLSQPGTQSLSQDPFNSSVNRVNGDGRPTGGKSALFEKLSSSTNIVTPVNGGMGLSLEGMETPVAGGGISTTEIAWDKDNELRVTEDVHSTEPPQAPTRKARTFYGLGVDLGTDAPPRMKSTSSWRSKTKTHGDSEDADPAGFGSTFSSMITDRKRTASGQVSQGPTNPHSSATNGTNNVNNDPGAPQRRSARLFNLKPQSTKFSTSSSTLGMRDSRDLKKVKATGTKGRSSNPSTVGRVVSGNRKHDPMDLDAKDSRNPNITVTQSQPLNSKSSAINDRVKELEALQWLLDLFTKLAGGYFSLAHYQCQDAIQIFETLTPSQKDTPWVMSQIGRAYFEQASYQEAAPFFSRIKSLAPSRLQDMEIYSTILWHLKAEIELAHLAHEVIDNDRLSPQAWCAVGNSFSLQRDHDQALKCFKRATQLDPKFAYAYTLQGHEHISNEEYDKAMASYRDSIKAENRHYNAWYGLGRVFEKQGKYNEAEQHYRIAASINPTNAVLVCCIGVVLEKNKNPKAALLQYARSCELAPKSTLSRFKKARVLMSLGKPDLALAELWVLKDLAPDEANVHFLLGKVLATVGRNSDAVKHYTMALHLDPKASQCIKEAMEQLEDGAVVDEDIRIA
ncbi:anaphase-promoting complex subunit cdc27 [Agyrium rufum]|nr:anaphase-promoting complex subunit cdc27 [Agyrium rufum]